MKKVKLFTRFENFFMKKVNFFTPFERIFMKKEAFWSQIERKRSKGRRLGVFSDKKYPKTEQF
jgi:hypothetical protein